MLIINEQFAFLVYCYRVKAIFHNLRTVLYWRLCGVTNSPHEPLLNTLSTEADVHGVVLSNNGFRMANCFCCLSQNAMVCNCSLPSRITTKVLKNCKTFSSRPRPRPRPKCSRARPRLSFLSSRRLETKTLVSRTTSLVRRDVRDRRQSDRRQTKASLNASAH